LQRALAAKQVLEIDPLILERRSKLTPDSK
jgi:hypothetical protein